MVRYRISSLSNLLDLLVAKYGEYDNKISDVFLLDAKNIDFTFKKGYNRYDVYYLYIENREVSIMVHTKLLYGKVYNDLETDVVFGREIVVEMNDSYDGAFQDNDFLIVQSDKYLYELHGYIIKDNIIKFDVAKRIPLDDNKLDLNDSLILVYYINDKVSKIRFAENVGYIREKLFLNKDNVKELIIPTDGETRIECIYPKQPDENTNKLLEEINKKYDVLMKK